MLKKLIRYLDNLHWLYRYALGIIILAGLVNLLMYLPLPTLSFLDSSDWLTFWGGYLGGAIGCIPAFAAIHESRKQAAEQHQESVEQRRCSAMPMLDIRFYRDIYLKRYDGESVTCVALNTDGTYLETSVSSKQEAVSFIGKRPNASPYYFCTIENIGLGPLSQFSLSLSISPSQEPIRFKHHPLGIQKSSSFIFVIPHGSSLSVDMDFSDIFGFSYTQTAEFKYDPVDAVYISVPVSSPVLKT